MINQPEQLTDARRPRSVVRLTSSQSSGATVTDTLTGWVEWEVNTNAFYQADTFRVTFAQSGLPDAYNLAWWASQRQMWIEILAGLPDDPDNIDESQMKTWIYGMVDEVHYDPVKRTIEVSGRDLTALMIDTKTTLKWQNLVASDIVTEIAWDHGLSTETPDGTPTVTPTLIPAGKYCNDDNASMTDQRSEWDLLTWLAQQEGFVVFVRGQNIYFQPKPNPATDAYVIEWQQTGQSGIPQANVAAISFSRNLTLTRDVTVQVQSWTYDYPTKPYVKTATAKHNEGSPGEPQTYNYVIPNLTPDQAAQRAQAYLDELTAHEVKMSASLPADNLLDVTSIIEVTGTGSDFDQLYYPEEIVRRMSLEEGYVMEVSAKNSSPLSTETT